MTFEIFRQFLIQKFSKKWIMIHENFRKNIFGLTFLDNFRLLKTYSSEDTFDKWLKFLLCIPQKFSRDLDELFLNSSLESEI